MRKRNPVKVKARVLGPDGKPFGFKPSAKPLVDANGRQFKPRPVVTPIFGANGERLVDPLRVSPELMKRTLEDPHLRLSLRGRERIGEAEKALHKIRGLDPTKLQDAVAFAVGTALGVKAFQSEVWHDRLARCITPNHVANVLLELIALEQKTRPFDSYLNPFPTLCCYGAQRTLSGWI